MNAVGTAARRWGETSGFHGASASHDGWTDQFSPASLDDRRARRIVDALYRGATVRL